MIPGRRSLGDLLRGDGVALGTWNQIAAPEIVDLIGWSGFRFAIIDCEHGPFGIEAAERQGRACVAAGLAPAVRAPRADPVWIGQALDAGLGHVVVPLSPAEEAARAVAAARLAPRGTRGACPCVRSCGHFATDWGAYVEREEAETGVVALVEAARAMDALGAILAVEGLRALMPGPFDLSVSMVHSGAWRAPAVRATLEGAVARASEAGVPVIMPVFAADRAECAALIEGWRAQGVRAFTLGSDKIVLADALRSWGALGRGG